MQWEPNDKAWQSYIKLEERYNELDRASSIYERFIGCKPVPKNWIAWSKFEEDRGQAGTCVNSFRDAADRVDKAREVFQTALEFFGDEEEQIEKAQVGSLC
jgi:crooked neck